MWTEEKGKEREERRVEKRRDKKREGFVCHSQEKEKEGLEMK